MINDVLNIYVKIIIEFIIEFAAFIAIIFSFFKRRKPFIPRLLLSILAIFAFGFGMSFAYYFIGSLVWGRIIIYFALFAAIAGLLFLCFDEKIITVIFASGLAYAMQNAMYKTWLLFYVGAEQFGWVDIWADSGNLDFIYHVLYYSFITLFVVVIAIIYVKLVHRRFNDRAFNKKVLMVTALGFIATVVLCSYQDVYFSRFSVIRENHFDDPNFYFLRQSDNLLSLLACVLILYLGFKAANENRLEKEVEYLEYTIRQSKQQYEISKDTIERINIKCHDIKYQIRSLSLEGLKEEDLKRLEESVTIYDSKFDTGNQPLNVLLCEKSLYCEKHKINFSCMIDGTNFDFMESGDLYCMFSNIIDNALEAVAKIKDKDKRIINLSAKRRGNMILIDEDNYYVGELEFQDGLPVTIKDDKNYHGFGTRSLRMIVRKYGGEMTTTSKEHVFHLSIILVDNSTK